MNLENRKVTVFGLARSGVAAANLLNEMGAIVTVTDSKKEEDLTDSIGQLNQIIKLDLGGHTDETVLGADLIVISPGIPLDIPPLVKAKGAGIKIIGELELAYQMTKVPFIGISGTNGKTTTTTLIGKLLEAGGSKVVVGGNIGYPLTRYVQNSELDYFVAEISSFQLETIDKFRPHIAVLLNITPDHLDRYATFEEYFAAKARFFINQTANDYAILNADDPMVLEAAKNIRAKKIYFSRNQELPEGIMVIGGKIMARLDDTFTEICSVKDLGIPGVHNLENALAATSAAIISGMTASIIKKVLAGFKPLEHRLEFVSEIKGVTFINDSKGTNVGAVEKSLASFEQPIILIAGGKDKGGDFASLLSLIDERVKKIVLIGEAREKLKQEWKAAKNKIHEADSMKDAVRLSFELASEGDVVLLSPACASFDMFKNYEERGGVFKSEVRKLEYEVRN